MTLGPPAKLHGMAHLLGRSVAAAVALCACAAYAQDSPSTRIVVTATRRALPELDAPASTSVVTRRDIEQRGADNVLDAVRGETGIALQGRAVGGRKVFGVRGMDSRHALFLVDGRRIGASDGTIGASDFQYDWIAVEDIERIEVVRGPMSVLYGSEALGGVVNVITRRPGSAWRLGATSEAADADGGRGGGGWRLAARADGPLGDTAWLRAGAAASRSDPVGSSLDPRLSELEARDKRDAWFALGWQPAPGHRLEAEHRQGDERRQADARERGGKRRYHVTVNEVERALDALAWEASWSSQFESQLRTYATTIEVENRRTEGVAINLPQRIDERVLEGQATWATPEAHTLLGGFETRNEALRDPGLPGGRALLRHRSLYAQDEWRLSPSLTLTLGLRHDDHERYGRQWSPRLYGVWHLAGPWTVKGGASHGFKVPNLKQVVPGARQEGPNTFLGNPDLEPERSNAVELGVAFYGTALQAQLTAFDQRVDDLIEVRLVAPGPTPGIGTYTYENMAKARLRGVELTAAHPLGAGLMLRTNLSHLDASDGNGRRLERRPRWAVNVNLDWTRGPWRAGLRAEHVRDQRLPATAVGAPPQRVPDTTLVGAHAGLALQEGLDVSFSVSNLGNLRLAEKSPLFTHAEAPRTWRVTLRGRW
jgi:outer membrane receptor for ferrienterochelin and colicins